MIFFQRYHQYLLIKWVNVAHFRIFFDLMYFKDHSLFCSLTVQMMMMMMMMMLLLNPRIGMLLLNILKKVYVTYHLQTLISASKFLSPAFSDHRHLDTCIQSPSTFRHQDSVTTIISTQPFSIHQHLTSAFSIHQHLDTSIHSPSAVRHQNSVTISISTLPFSHHKHLDTSIQSPQAFTHYHSVTTSI